MKHRSRLLFITRLLPQREVAVGDVTGGRTAVSGTISSFLMVAESLSRRSHDVGVLSLTSGQVATGSYTSFTDVSTALSWVGGSMSILCSVGDEDSLNQLTKAGSRPLLWSHVHLSAEHLAALEDGRLEGVITVSDLARLAFLHSPERARIGRIYNPLNPFFAEPAHSGKARYETNRVVFAGYLSELKGAHRLLQMWRNVRRRLPGATLTVCGSIHLYSDVRAVGPFGVADPEFEERYLLPLVKEFGSIEAAGIRFAGLLPPAQLKALYEQSALGVVNCNIDGPAETFCCAAVEMMATRLPVFSFARGSLPETIGRSGGAFLAKPELESGAEMLANVAAAPGQLAIAGEAGRSYAVKAYDLDRITDAWERLIEGGSANLDRTTGAWEPDRSARYYVERFCGRLKLHRPYRFALGQARRLRG